MKIIQISQYTDEVLEALNVLLPQLSASALPLNVDDLIGVIESDSSHMLMADKCGRFIGTLTLVILEIPTGVKARIEDLVVNDKERGQGVGRMLIEQALVLALERGALTVSLTSNRSRKAANRLYQKAGFRKLDTNVYQYKIVQ